MIASSPPIAAAQHAIYGLSDNASIPIAVFLIVVIVVLVWMCLWCKKLRRRMGQQEELMRRDEMEDLPVRTAEERRAAADARAAAARAAAEARAAAVASWVTATDEEVREVTKTRTTAVARLAVTADEASSSSLPSSTTIKDVFVYSDEADGEPLVCTICYSELEDGHIAKRIAQCGHTFHVNCLIDHVKKHDGETYALCPVCRGPILAY